MPSALKELDRRRPGDDVFQHPIQPAAFGTNPEDGLPQEIVESAYEDNLAPALSVTNLVCMEDRSRYVLELDNEDIVFEPHDVEFGSRGEPYVRADLLSLTVRQKLYLEPTGFFQRLLWRLLRFIRRAEPQFVEVQPIRRQCEHYRRQLIDFSREHKQVVRLCIAQKTEDGEFFSISNCAVYACELREPRHPETEELIHAFDDEKIAAAAREEETFDVAGAFGAGGIFSGGRDG